jgi:hypothetical protein
LQLKSEDGGYISMHQDGNSVLFFEANQEARSLHSDSGNEFTREGFINYFLYDNLFQNLNAEDYSFTIYVPIYIGAKIKAETKLWCYNNLFLVKEINRQTVSPYFQKLQLRLYKIKRPGVN